MKNLKSIIINLCLFILVKVILTSCKIDSQFHIYILGKWTVKTCIITNFEHTGTSIDYTKNKNSRPIFEINEQGNFANTLEVNPQFTAYSLFTINTGKHNYIKPFFRNKIVI